IQNKDVSVNWTVAESNIASYQIQRSSNAVEFTTVGTVVANGNAISSTQKYNWIDAEPLNGNNYYRIIANGKDGKTTNSSIVLVRLSDNSSITVYPNPVKDRRMNLLTESLAKGDYEIQVYNLEGKNIYSSIIKHNGGTASYVINLPLAVTSGMYQMIIKGKEYTNTQNIVVE
ncbi:MAG TPA: T9SS type A sorting domain-containing protein, partial [Chitinophagaceae bacterium]|nr:T9SS type A sorting domain-containing protein [Chitinophagaceae bacterium]